MNQLKDILVNEVSLVDAGANPEAHVLLIKRKEEKSMAEKVEKQVGEEVVKTEEVETVEKQAPETVIKEETKPAPDVTLVEKSGVEELTKTLEDLTARLNAHIEKAENAEFMKIAEKYELLGEDSAKLADMLKRAKHENAAMYDTAIRVLDGALAAVKKAGTFEELGKTGYSAGEAQIEKIADEIQKREPTLSRRMAIDKAFQQHPELQY